MDVVPGLQGALFSLDQEGRLAGELVCGIDPRRQFAITRRLGLDEDTLTWRDSPFASRAMSTTPRS